MLAGLGGRRPRDRQLLRPDRGSLFEDELGGLGPEIVPVEEPEPLGRGGGLRLAAEQLQERRGLRLNGDELVDLDFSELLPAAREPGAAATIAVAPLESPFGVVELGEDDLVTGFRGGARACRTGSAAASTSSARRRSSGCPSEATTSDTTFPELAAEGKLAAFRHEGSG